MHKTDHTLPVDNLHLTLRPCTAAVTFKTKKQCRNKKSQNLTANIEQHHHSHLTLSVERDSAS